MDIQDALEKWLYANVGAAALVSEHMKKTVDTLVAKGQDTVKNNQDTFDSIRLTVDGTVEDVKEQADKVRNSELVKELTKLTQEQRDSLRNMIDEADLTAKSKDFADKVGQGIRDMADLAQERARRKSDGFPGEDPEGAPSHGAEHEPSKETDDKAEADDKNRQA